MTGKFIVIEGLDATGKSTLAPKLAECLEATLLACPPRLKAPELSKEDLRSHFDCRPPVQRRAVRQISSPASWPRFANRSMDRYWTSTVAFAALDVTRPLMVARALSTPRTGWGHSAYGG